MPPARRSPTKKWNGIKLLFAHDSHAAVYEIDHGSRLGVYLKEGSAFSTVGSIMDLRTYYRNNDAT